jgi:glucose-6-phosphate isomerase
MAAAGLPRRIWQHDYTLWKPEPTEITDRLGWLHTADVIEHDLERLDRLTRAAREAGYTQAVVLGMGGSSLAPELFARTFPTADGHLELSVLDSTVPGAVLAAAQRLDPARALFLVSSKSGTTVETLALFRHFHRRAAEAVGEERVGEHFVAITDPKSPLAEAGRRLRFREVVLNDTTIGGRYSALSHFGLAPAALKGLDLISLLRRAQEAVRDCAPEADVRDNPGVMVGAILGELARQGRDKLTLLVSPQIAAFGPWVEQLVAESTGKEGRGILPVVGEAPAPPSVYGDDRLFVHVQQEGDSSHDAALAEFQAAGHPTVHMTIHDRYDLGRQFFVWELATAVAAVRLEINPFDQPNVESAKQRAKELVATYAKEGKLPEEEPTLRADGIELYGEVAAGRMAEALRAFIGSGTEGGYLALHAYLEPTPATDRALSGLATAIRERTRLATTVGYGPRFLHSTGQLHKGDAGRGLFIQLTANDAQDVPIPDDPAVAGSPISFRVLTEATVRGDARALREAGRRVARFHLGDDAVAGLGRLIGWLG